MKNHSLQGTLNGKQKIEMEVQKIGVQAVSDFDLTKPDKTKYSLNNNLKVKSNGVISNTKAQVSFCF